jgi:4-hydroxy-3-methylbut-2-enyl diphosphate reductase
LTTHEFLPDKRPVKIILTSGASCPDTLVDRVLLKIAEYFSPIKSIEEAIKEY